MNIKGLAIFPYVLFLLFCANTIYAQEAEVDIETVMTGNRVVSNIYKEIYKQKREHLELKNFSRKSMQKNDLGIYLLYYRYNDYLSIKKDELYHFGVTVNKVGSENIFEEFGLPFKFKFPVLGVQLIGGKSGTIEVKRQFDIEPIVDEMFVQLWQLQQGRLPYQLKAKVLKKTVEVDEPIEIQLELLNTTPYKRKLKALGSKMITVEIDENVYGVPRNISKKLKRAKSAGSVILKSQGTATKRIKLSGFEESGDYLISCTYLDPHKGVFPQSVFRIEVKDSN